MSEKKEIRQVILVEYIDQKIDFNFEINSYFGMIKIIVYMLSWGLLVLFPFLYTAFAGLFIANVFDNGFLNLGFWISVSYVFYLWYFKTWNVQY